MFNPEIIYEDTNVLVLNKPAGLSVHKDGRNDEVYTLADWLIENYPETKDVGEPMTAQNGKTIERPGIVHRLDRDTSGVIVIAKNQKSFTFLKDQFKSRNTRKTYLVLVIGSLLPPRDREFGVINLPIGRSKNDARIRVASLKAEKPLREATTYYRILNNFKGYTYLEAFPKTGRTHQLRAHFKAIKHPIAGDKLYAGKAAEGNVIDRLALHAYELEICLPDGAKKKFQAPLPADFEAALEKLKSL